MKGRIGKDFRAEKRKHLTIVGFAPLFGKTLAL